jgi:transposase-like protein
MTAAEKREAMRLAEESDLSVRRTLRELQVLRTTFYRWYRRYRRRRGRPCAAALGGPESLQNETPADMYHGRQAAILARPARIKQRTLQRRKQENLQTPHHAAIGSELSL